tara:strand:+ start:190 stop:510 length:321 start_codon:yes stop_codon:yes gene_type:complete
MTGLRRNVPSYEAYSPNGLLRERSTYKDGEWDGLVESYYENGQLKTKATYKDDERDGPSEYYYESGQLESKGTYNMGEDRGEWIEDGETGHLRPLSSRPRKRQLAP